MNKIEPAKRDETEMERSLRLAKGLVIPRPAPVSEPKPGPVLDETSDNKPIPPVVEPTPEPEHVIPDEAPGVPTSRKHGLGAAVFLGVVLGILALLVVRSVYNRPVAVDTLDLARAQSIITKQFLTEFKTEYVSSLGNWFQQIGPKYRINKAWPDFSVKASTYLAIESMNRDIEIYKSPKLGRVKAELRKELDNMVR